MKGYFECGKCSKQWEQSGNSITPKCPGCGGNNAAMMEISSGPPPSWYKSNLLRRIVRATLERKS